MEGGRSEEEPIHTLFYILSHQYILLLSSSEVFYCIFSREREREREEKRYDLRQAFRYEIGRERYTWKNFLIFANTERGKKIQFSFELLFEPRK
jgi:hypothetical protein